MLSVEPPGHHDDHHGGVGGGGGDDGDDDHGGGGDANDGDADVVPLHSSRELSPCHSPQVMVHKGKCLDTPGHQAYQVYRSAR